MKLNKLLTPVLGLATVATVVAPIATSCTTNNTVEHVKVSAKSLEKNCDGEGICTYVLVLDSADYDKNGFRITATVSKDDKTIATSEDFKVLDWTLDGDHLTVPVQYVGTAEVEDDITVKLNLNVYYGTEWNKSLDVKFGYAAKKGIKMELDTDSGGYPYFTAEPITLKKGENYTLSADLSLMSSTQFKKYVPDYFYFGIPSKQSGGFHKADYVVCFKTLTLYNNGKEVDSTNYRLNEFPLPGLSGYYSSCYILPDYREKLSNNDVLTFEVTDLAIYNFETSSLVNEIVGYSHFVVD